MKRFIILSLFVFTSFILSASQTSALGLGGYLGLTNGSYDWTYTLDDSDSTELDDSADLSRKGLGFVLDTNVAKDSLFNYRLNVGYSFFSVSNGDRDDITGIDFHLYNTFGFGLVKTKSVRFWLGPQVGFGAMQGDENDWVKEYKDLYAGIGIAAGLNIHLSEKISLGIDGGIRRCGHFGYADTVNSYSTYSSTVGVTGSGNEIFANLSILVRINDSYNGKASAPAHDDLDLDI